MSLVLLLTWALAAAVVALYVWFVVWRVRADRRKKEMAGTVSPKSAAPTAASGPAPAVDHDRLNATISAAARIAGTREPSPTAADPLLQPSGGTVAEALAGIKMPHELAPITMVAPRPGVGDRVVFATTTAPAEAVGTALGDELERLGYEVKPLDPQTIAARRDAQRLILMIHPDGAQATIGEQRAFAAAADRSVVVEVWIP